jgi:hypothetical protein
MVEHSNVGVGEGTLESEKWWNIIMTVVAVKVVDYRILSKSPFIYTFVSLVITTTLFPLRYPLLLLFSK